MIEAERFAIGNVKQEASSIRISVESRMIRTPSKVRGLAIWNEQSVKWGSACCIIDIHE